MIAQLPNSYVFSVLGAKANESVRRVSSLYLFSAHLLLRCVRWLQSVLSSNTAWSPHRPPALLCLLRPMSPLQSP
jgi:NhaP-type Na+/H+ or K+/H+ antiporter